MHRVSGAALARGVEQREDRHAPSLRKALSTISAARQRRQDVAHPVSVAP